MMTVETYNLLVEIAENRGIKAEARKKWNRNGVPQKVRVMAYEYAPKKGIELDVWVFDNFRDAAAMARKQAA